MFEVDSEEQGDTHASIERVSVSELFDENSKQKRHDWEFAQRIQRANQNIPLHQIITQSFKWYRGAKTVSLPSDFSQCTLSFDDVMLRRRSIRAYSGHPL